MTTPKHIVLVGHCTPDAFAIRSALTTLIPGVQVSSVTDADAASAAARDASLLLVNRALDGEFPDATGVELIARLAPTAKAKLMLISNYPDAQAAAVAAGAVQGFGKSSLYSASMKSSIAAALEA
jgi:hypothetical protein